MQQLSIKPEAGQTTSFTKAAHSGELVSFRSLDIFSDLPLIHDWVNQSYAKRFWQLNRSFHVIQSIYESVLYNPLTHSFIGLINEMPVAQIDVYAVTADELGGHLDHPSDFDTGLHLLMCPPQQMQKGWSKLILQCFQEFYFSNKESGHLYAEPDQENYAANRLAINTGFQFIKTIQLSYKTANLYRITRDRFNQH